MNYTDTDRLNFMLCHHRKVIVEVLPGNAKEFYVEGGFMGDEQGPSIIARGEITAEELLSLKRNAIDMAMLAGESDE